MSSGLLDVDAGDVRLAADDPRHLVDLVQADGGALHRAADLLGGRPGAEDLAGALLEAGEQPAGVDRPLLGGEGVGVHDQDDPVLRELLVGVVERLDPPHDGGLAGPRVADQQEVAVALPLEVLEDGDRDIAQALALADHALGRNSLISTGFMDISGSSSSDPGTAVAGRMHEGRSVLHPSLS